MPEGSHYLNCAYMSPLPRRVQEAGIAGVRRKAAPMEIRSEDFFTECDEVRRLFARLVSAEDPGRIAIIPSVSYGLATAARNTPLARGQRVVTIARQFPSNVLVWRRLCDTAGASLVAVDAPAGSGDRSDDPAAAWNEALLEAIDGETAAVSLEPIHWTDGTRFDLEAIGARAREVGAAFIVDGTQFVGARPLDVSKLRPDALVCAGYKWLLGPYSIGAAWFGPRYDDGVPLEETWIAREGSDDFSSLVDPGEAYRPGAARYDVGETSDFILVPMLLGALEQLLEWGVEEISAYIRRLVDELFADPRLEVLGIAGDPPDSPHLFGLRLPAGDEPKRVRAGLRARHVHVAVRGHFVRVSPHVYNDRDDVEALIEALLEARGG